MKPEQAIFPILFFVISAFVAILVVPIFLKFLNIRLSSQSTVFVWGTGGITLLVLIALVVVTVYHLSIWSYLFVGALFLLLSLYVAMMMYKKRRQR